jgi:hypothetical protein
MDRAWRLVDEACGPTRPLNNLHRNIRYPVIGADIYITPYGTVYIHTIFDSNKNVNVKVLLPGEYEKDFGTTYLVNINSRAKQYTLIYRGLRRKLWETSYVLEVEKT